MVRTGEIACYKQFLLFSQCFPQLYIILVLQNAVLCGNGLTLSHLDTSSQIYKDLTFKEITYGSNLEIRFFLSKKKSPPLLLLQ